MKSIRFRNKILFRMIVASIILTLSVCVFIVDPTLASSRGTNLPSTKASSEHNVDPCDLLPPGGEISTQNETTCAAQYSSNPGEKIVQIQPNIHNHETDTLCSNLTKPSDFHVYMSDVDFGDCGIQAEIGYQGEPAPGYTGWQILFYYEGFYVRVATSQVYPANKSWIYDTAEAIEKTIQDAFDTTTVLDPSENETSDNQRGERKSEEECAQMQRDVAEMAENASASTADDLKLGIIAEVVSAPSSGPAIHDYCAGGEGALRDGSLIKIGDCVRNGEKVLILMKTQDSDNSGATIIELNEDSEVCFDEFAIHETFDPMYQSVTTFVKGVIHIVHKTWKGRSIFSVKAGTTVLGGRGTDFFVQYDPDYDFVQVLVIEGHVDVTSKTTGETKNLSDNQGVVVSGGDMMDTMNVSQEMWDSYMEEYGLGNADFSELEINENTSTPTYNEDETIYSPKQISPRFKKVLLLCIAPLCTIFFISIIIGIVIQVRKRSKQ